MKNFILFLLAASMVLASKAQQAASANTVLGGHLELKEAAFDFGKIQQGKPVTHDFELVNHGIDTLKLENVQASCGCTTPVWSKDPVAPGAGAVIRVGYNAAAEGNFEKLVTIYYNGGQTKSLTIKGNVYRVPATSAPQNTSILLLKQTNR